MGDEVRWLSDDEQKVWRRWLLLNSLLPQAIHRDLQADAGLSLPDFDVLVQLTDRPEQRVRVTELSRSLTWERSRVSHHVARMEKRGLVTREDCADDARGAYVVLTDAGREAIEGAAPRHVELVRRLIFDALSPDDIAALDVAVTTVLDRIDEL